MRKIFTALFVCFVFSIGISLAQSSGNFVAHVATAKCILNDQTGAITGGLNGTVLSSTIKTPNSGSTGLVIRPSLVTGLYTRTTVTKDTSLAAAVAGVKVRVLIDGLIVAPGTTVGAQPTDGLNGNLADDGNGDNDGWVDYNKRFQQLSTNIFNLLAEDCDPLTEEIEPCYIDLITSTLSANSMDFVVGDVGVGEHTLKVEWKLQPTDPDANQLACVGPGVLTVMQVKTFSQGSGIVITEQN